MKQENEECVKHVIENQTLNIRFTQVSPNTSNFSKIRISRPMSIILILTKYKNRQNRMTPKKFLRIDLEIYICELNQTIYIVKNIVSDELKWEFVSLFRSIAIYVCMQFTNLISNSALNKERIILLRIFMLVSLIYHLIF